ncbi:MAG TPA: hypothetical protein V6D07_08640 [Trichocoleus sp.]
MNPNPEMKPKVRWKKLLLHGSLWVSTEVLLGAVGLDNLADYSEFLMQSRLSTHLMEVVSNVVTML